LFFNIQIELMKEDENQDAGFREFWDCEFNDDEENPMLKITRESRTAYASFISLIGQAMIGCSKWRRFLDLGSIQGYALSGTISTADEAFALLALQNSRDKWNEEAEYRKRNNLTALVNLNLEKERKKYLVKAKYSQGEDDLNGWSERGVALCADMNREIIAFRAEDISVENTTYNKQKYFEEHGKEIWCKQDTNGSKKKSNSPIQNAAKKRKLHLREESLARHCFDFETDELVGQVAV